MRWRSASSSHSRERSPCRRSSCSWRRIDAAKVDIGSAQCEPHRGPVCELDGWMAEPSLGGAANAGRDSAAEAISAHAAAIARRVRDIGYSSREEEPGTRGTRRRGADRITSDVSASVLCPLWMDDIPRGVPETGDAIPPFWGSARRPRCLTLSVRIEKANPLRSGHAKQEVSPRRRLGYRNRGLAHPTAFVDLRRSTSIAGVEPTGAEIARDHRIAPPGQAPRQRLDPHRYGERMVGSCGGQTRETEDEATVRSRRCACPRSARNR